MVKPLSLTLAKTLVCLIATYLYALQEPGEIRAVENELAVNGLVNLPSRHITDLVKARHVRASV